MNSSQRKQLDAIWHNLIDWEQQLTELVQDMEEDENADEDELADLHDALSNLRLATEACS